jgi:ubiquinone/menaquinone biosynthesis C-methylase UbiE
VRELVLAEPDRHMQKALRRRIEEEEVSVADIVAARAEDLPFEDSSFDCVTCTMVLCTVPEPMEALAEVARVLKPGGKFLFLEHVRSEDPKFARKQDHFEKGWRFIADGCHCNRDSLATIEASPLQVEEFKRSQMPGAPLFMTPLVYGSAVLPAA